MNRSLFSTQRSEAYSRRNDEKNGSVSGVRLIFSLMLSQLSYHGFYSKSRSAYLYILYPNGAGGCDFYIWMVLSMRIHTHYTMTHIDRGAVKQVTKIWQGVRDDDEGYQVMDEG